jgi:hypothetical protein
MNALYQLALADFRERTRRFSFLVMIALAVFLGYQVIGGAFELRLGAYRGLLNAAWIGTLMALTLGFFLSLVGFYMTRGNVQQDRQTGVGQILAATPLSKWAYLLGKFASNTAVLLVVIGVLALAALAMLLIHGEDKTLNLYQLLMPFVVFTLPVALLVAATAVFFEAAAWLRGSGGNVIFFFLWLFVVPALGGHLLAFNAVEEAMTTALQAQGAEDYQGGIVLAATDMPEIQTFLWTGFDWAATAAPRLVYVAVALLLVGLAALFFERFDPTQSLPRRRLLPRFSWPKLSALWPRQTAAAPLTAIQPRQLTSVAPANNPLSLFAALIVAELKLLLKGRPYLWYAGAVGLFLACLFAPLETVRGLLPYVWLWPLLIWSEMGVRERRYGVDQLLWSAPAPLGRQLPAAWLAGVALAFLLGGGAFIRFLAEPALLYGFMAGVFFVPSLALFLGTATGSERPLQIILLVYWYLGVLNGLPILDFTGATAAAVAKAIPGYYLSAVPLLVGLTFWFWRRQRG